MVLLFSIFWMLGIAVPMDSNTEISEGLVYVFAECLKVSKPSLRDPKAPIRKYVDGYLLPHFQSHFEKIQTSSDPKNPLWTEMLSRIQKSSQNSEFFTKLYGVVVEALKPQEVEDLLLVEKYNDWFYEHFYARHSQRISGSIGYN